MQADQGKEMGKRLSTPQPPGLASDVAEMCRADTSAIDQGGIEPRGKRK